MKKAKDIFAEVSRIIKSHYLHILSALLIILVIIVVYWRDFEILANEALHNEDASHIALVPFFVGILLYRKKEFLKASITTEKFGEKGRAKYLNEAIGVALCLIAFLLYWYGSYTFYPLEYHLLSLPIFVAGTIMILFSFKTLLLIVFPILFLLFLIPPPTQIIYTLSGLMANFNTQASYTILNALRLPVVYETSYGPPTIAVTSTSGEPIYFAIGLPCSGVYSFIAFLLFATFLAYIVIAPAIKKAALFVLGFAVFGIANIIRIVSIVSVGYWFGEETAMFVFHTVAGWLLILAGMFLVLFVSEKFWKIQLSQPLRETSECSICEIDSKKLRSFCSDCGKFLSRTYSRISSEFWAKLLLLLLGSYLVTLSIQAPTFVVAQGPLGITASSGWENATNVFPQIPDYKLEYYGRDETYERLARQDASLLYAYIPLNVSNQTVYVDLGVANTISNLHSWEVCLITYQTSRGQYPLVSVLESQDIPLLEDIPLIARYLVFESPENYTQVTLYWYTKATFKVGLTVTQKYVRTSLIIITRNSTQYPEFKDKLVEFGQSIASFWTPLISQSLVSIGIPMQQALLGLAIAFVAITKTAEQTRIWQRKTRNLRVFNSFASKDEKLVFQTVQDLLKDAKFVQTKQIASALKTKTKPPIQNDTLNDILKTLEKHELIKRDIANVDGNPALVWKP